uniref:Uncharacterized protein n=1 Tax=Aegilops tauschii TaxID=37682 RepID=M8CW35_AEGTA
MADHTLLLPWPEKIKKEIIRKKESVRCCSNEEKLLQDVLLPSYPHLGLSEEAKQWDRHVMKGCKGDMSIDCLRYEDVGTKEQLGSYLQKGLGTLINGSIFVYLLLIYNKDDFSIAVEDTKI